MKKLKPNNNVIFFLFFSNTVFHIKIFQNYYLIV